MKRSCVSGNSRPGSPAGSIRTSLRRVDRAALLAKADLDTQMVCEFAELQGIMGREYALLAGEDPIVAKAIYEHYLPTAAGGDLPETDEGAIVSIADKTDTIVRLLRRRPDSDRNGRSLCAAPPGARHHQHHSGETLSIFRWIRL